MKIIHLTGEFPPYSTGGLGRYVYELTQCQARTDNKVAVLLNRGSEIESVQPQPAAFLTEYHEAVLNSGTHKKYSSGIIDPESLAHTVPDDITSPDIIHVHDWYGVLPALRLQHTTDAQVVYSAHLPLRAGFTYSGHAVSKRVKMRIESVGLRNADVVIAPTSSTASLLKREYEVSSHRIHVIPNGVDTSKFTPGDEPTMPNRIFAVGRMTEQKGFHYLIDAIDYLDDSADLEVIVAGDGPERDSLISWTEKNGLTDHIAFPGRVSEKRLLREYRRAIVTAVPSVYETFGLVCLESMACGTPVVGFEAKGIQSIVQDRVNGRLARPHTSKELAMRLQSMLKDIDDQKPMSKAALQTAEDHDWNTISRKIFSVYADLSN